MFKVRKQEHNKDCMKQIRIKMSNLKHLSLIVLCRSKIKVKWCPREKCKKNPNHLILTNSRMSIGQYKMMMTQLQEKYSKNLKMINPLKAS